MDEECEICQNSSQYVWRMDQVELDVIAVTKKVDSVYKLMLGTLVSSLTTLLGVVLLILITNI